MARVESCCCCMSVRTGCLVLGWIGAIFGGLGFLGIISGAGVYSNQPGGSAGFGVMAFLEMVAGITLLIAVYQEKSDFTIPYLIVSFLEIVRGVLVVIFFLIIGLFISGAPEDKKHPDAEAAAYTISITYAIGALISVHFFMVVNTFRHMLREGSGGGLRQTV